MKTFDVVIVGGGSTGAVLASRLSEKSSRSVLLIDAGPFYRSIAQFPPELLQASSLAALTPGHPNNWGYVGELMPGREYPLLRGKVVGGSSVINGGYFIRGRRADFDDWAAQGNASWSYESVLPYFIKSEADADFPSHDLHGSDGPMRVRRPGQEELRPVSCAFSGACHAAGYAEDDDKNAENGVGVGLVPRNIFDGMRWNTAVAYLTHAADRPNLTILPHTLVSRVVVDHSRAVGVEVSRGGREETYYGGEVVLSAGGIESPHLLLLSGIGPAEQLRSYGIPVLHDLPVGRGIQDHPSVPVHYRIEQDTPVPPDLTPVQACLNYTADGSIFAEDMQLGGAGGSFSGIVRDGGGRNNGELPAFVFQQAVTRNERILMCSLNKEHSRGQLTLASRDPHETPRIRLNYLSAGDDRERMRGSVRLATRLLDSKEFRRLGVRRSVLDDDDLADDVSLDSWIDRNLTTAFHMSCGARMGLESDPEAVVDEQGRVHGVEGLRVLDISICPSVVRRGTHATAVMIGERASAFFG
jgi:choline dehydrogenase